MDPREQTVGQRVVRVVRDAAEKVGVNPWTVTLSTHLRDELGLSALSRQRLAVAIEAEFAGVAGLEAAITDRVLSGTVRDLVGAVDTSVKASR